MIVLTGASGFLGRHVLGRLVMGGVPHRTLGRRAGDDVVFDLSSPADAHGLREWLHPLAPAAVIHAGACSKVGDCARNPELARRVNVAATAALCDAVPSATRFVFVSTDLVFGGDRAPYRAKDAVDPRSVYGETKAEAERVVAAAGGVSVRLPLLFGPSADGRAGATDMIRGAIATGSSLSLYDNEFRTPLHAGDAASVLIEIAMGGQGESVLHVAGPERVSRYELAERLAARHGLDLSGVARGHCEDVERPRDVALVSDVATRSLDAMLGDA